MKASAVLKIFSRKTFFFTFVFKSIVDKHCYQESLLNKDLFCVLKDGNLFKKKMKMLAKNRYSLTLHFS